DGIRDLPENNNPTGHNSHRITAHIPDQRKHRSHDRKDNSHKAAPAPRRTAQGADQSWQA
ncbi:hypothetical protein, partial [Streptomyces sp. NPDC060031]|uniref:hypothetical protein n=1 Tax=Streptomyces sp. NPDC060031 TaxID=3347043 RepID=UPI00369A4D41